METANIQSISKTWQSDEGSRSAIDTNSAIETQDRKEEYLNLRDGSNKNHDEESKLEISLDSASHIEKLQQLSRFKLPVLRAIGVLNISEEPVLAYKFLDNSIPDRLESFYIGGDLFLKPKLSGVLPLVIKNASKITKEIWKDLEKLITAFAHVKTLGFYDCSFHKIYSSFKLPTTCQFSIEQLNFEETLDDSLTPTSIESILHAASNTSLKSTLTEINITRCELSSTDIKGKLDNYGMDIVSVETEKHWYFYNL